MSAMYIKVRGRQGVERYFYGVRSITRQTKKEKVTDIYTERRKVLDSMGLFAVVDPAFEFVDCDSKSKEFGYFAFEGADFQWTVIFFDGKVFVCNEAGNTVDSFDSKGFW